MRAAAKREAVVEGPWGPANFEKGAEIALALADPYSSLADAVEPVSKITSSISNAEEVREKVTTMIDVGWLAEPFFFLTKNIN